MLWISIGALWLMWMVQVRSLDLDSPYVYGNEAGAESLNFFENHDFEQPLAGTPWVKRGSQAVMTREAAAAYTGSYGLRFSKRVKDTDGIVYTLPFESTNGDGQEIKMDQLYYVSSHVRFITSPPIRPRKPIAYINMVFRCTVFYTDGGHENILIARRKFVFEDFDYFQFGGDFAGPKSAKGRTPTKYVIWLTVSPGHMTFDLDAFAFTIIDRLPDWKTTLETRINQNRKGTLQLTTNVPEAQRASTKIEVKMIDRPLKFGPALGNFAVDNPGVRKYLQRRVINYGTMTNALKWKNKLSGSKRRALRRSLAFLVDNGICIRGHALLWEIKESNPKKVQKLRGDKLVNAMKRRVWGMTTRYNGRVCEWDAMNEYGNAHFYESRTRKPGIGLLREVFKQAHLANPNAKHCLTDYLVLRDGQLTSAHVNTAFTLRRDGAKIGCLGLQGHLRVGDDGIFNVEQFLKRLRISGQIHEQFSDVTLSLTELSIHVADVNKRALITDMVMHAAFSQPGVYGIITWGTSEDVGAVRFESDTGLYYGTDFKPNAAGKVMDDLLNKWTPWYDYTPTKDSDDLKLFEGTYNITLSQNGEPRRHQEVIITAKNSTSLNLIY